MDTLRLGAKGRDVAVLQRLLGLEPDGVFGEGTRSGLAGFQKKAGLVADGIAGKKTWAALAARAPTVRRGDSGEAVAALQALLSLEVDGKFGAGTRGAVLDYQKAAGLRQDGIVGSKTWGLLLNGVTRSPGNSVAGRPVDFKQFDAGWKAVAYTVTGSKKQTIGSSGCGPTAFADIVATWIDPAFTPVEACKLALQWGCRTKDSGTTVSFFPKAAARFGLDFAYAKKGEFSRVLAALAEGALVVARMGPKYFTNGGHYITLWRADGQKVHVCDPGSSKPERMGAGYAVFEKEAKDYHIFRKGGMKDG